MTKIGYACMLEQFHPTDLLDWAEPAEAAGFDAGFQVSEHFHPWTPQQGQSAFAWSLHGRARAAHDAALRHRRDLPRLPLPPRGDRARGGDAGRHVPRPLLARPRRGRGAERARHRRRVAGGRHPQGDDVRVDRDHRQAVQRQGRQARRRVLHARVGPPLHAPRAAGADLRRHRRTGEREAHRPSTPTGSSPSARPTRRSRCCGTSSARGRARRARTHRPCGRSSRSTSAGRRRRRRRRRTR